ncbi:MAG: hypothetical protein ACREFP_21395 [Acetobacteraceae bacterium]
MPVAPKLLPEFAKETRIEPSCVAMRERALRQHVTTDIATECGAFDVATGGAYGVLRWSKNNWRAQIDGLGSDNDVNEIIPSVRAGPYRQGWLDKRSSTLVICSLLGY